MQKISILKVMLNEEKNATFTIYGCSLAAPSNIGRRKLNLKVISTALQNDPYY